MRHVLLLALILLLGLADAAADERPGSPDLGAVATSIVEQTNALRLQRGGSPLKPERALEAAARYYADYMAGTDTYGHTADGNEPAERAAAHGYEFCIVSENVAYSRRESGFDERALAEELMQGWIDSAGHRRNLLDAAVTEIGVAVSHSAASGRYYAVQMFGRPQSQSITFSIANESGRELSYRLAATELALPPGTTRMHRECRAPQIELRLPRGARPRARTLQPQDGEQIVIEERPEGWRVGQRQ